jgi:beta-alanine--pyruvate transaminase
MMRTAGESLVFTPPLIISEDEIGEIVEKTAKLIKATA